MSQETLTMYDVAPAIRQPYPGISQQLNLFADVVWDILHIIDEHFDMSINDLLPSKMADVSRMIAQNRGMQNGRPASNSLQISGGGSVSPSITRPDTTISAPSASTVQSLPHRAWEAGYLSPFARTPKGLPLDPLHNDTPSGYLSHHTDSPSNIRTRDIYPPLAIVNAPAPTPLSNLSASPLVRDTTTLQHSASIPQRSTSYRPRTRKVVTKEITLNDSDISAMVDLGMSPFMVGQDMIANQNRFVRNECVFARHFLRLQRATADADAHHSQTERDIYQHLEQHKASLDRLASGSGSGSVTLASGSHSARTDPNFLALEMAHQETCARVEALSRQMMEYSQSTQRALMELAQRIDQIIRTGDYSTNSDDVPRSRATATPPSLSPLLLSTRHSNVKRKRNSSSDSILESPRTMPPPTPDFRNHRLSGV